MSYIIKSLVAGPQFKVLATPDFERRSQAFAWFVDYVESHKGEIVYFENDGDHCMDLMAQLHGELCQFMIEPINLKDWLDNGKPII